MSEEQCITMCNVNDWGSSFLDKMVELEGLADDYGCFEGIRGVVALLSGEEERETGDEDEDEEEDDEEIDSDEAVSEDEEAIRDGIEEGRELVGYCETRMERELLISECFNKWGDPRRDAKSQEILRRLRPGELA